MISKIDNNELIANYSRHIKYMQTIADKYHKFLGQDRTLKQAFRDYALNMQKLNANEFALVEQLALVSVTAYGQYDPKLVNLTSTVVKIMPAIAQLIIA